MISGKQAAVIAVSVFAAGLAAPYLIKDGDGDPTGFIPRSDAIGLDDAVVPVLSVVAYVALRGLVKGS
jgi:hypothetical protein